MSLPLDDLERLGAFLDGSLEGAERDRFVERLGDDEELYELMLETRAVRAELDAESGGSVSAPRRWSRSLRGDRLWRRRFSVGLLASAALLAVVLAPRLIAPAPPTVEVLTEGLALRADDEAMIELLETPWSTLRGLTSPAVLEPVHGFRLGVRDVALRLALERGEVEGAKTQAAAAAQILDAAPGAGSSSAEYERIADELDAGTPPASLLDPHAHLVAVVEASIVDRAPVLYGRFVQSAWFAARVGDAAWFGRRTVRATLEQVAELAPTGDALSQALEPLLDGRGTAEELAEARRTLSLILESSGQP